MFKPVYDPDEAGNNLRISPWNKQNLGKQLEVFNEDKDSATP
jgi:hypothetical protein